MSAEAVYVPVFVIGPVIGYGIRAAISRRRRTAARRRFIETGHLRPEGDHPAEASLDELNSNTDS